MKTLVRQWKVLAFSLNYNVFTIFKSTFHCKSFIRPHLDNGGVIYDQPSNIIFSCKIESVQYDAALVITVALGGSPRDKLYQEFGLEYLHHSHWMRRLCLLYKVLPKYIYELILSILYTPLEILIHSLIYLS